MPASSIVGGLRAPAPLSLIPRIGMAPALARAARRRLEVVLAGYRLTFPRVRDARVEWVAFPSMIELYWSLAEADPLGAPPSQTDFGREVAARLPDLPGDIEEVRAFIDWQADPARRTH